MFSTDPKVAESISGVILFHETLYQKDDAGNGLADLLKKRGIIPGIKVDCGVVNLYGSEDETTTQGECTGSFLLIITSSVSLVQRESTNNFFLPVLTLLIQLLSFRRKKNNTVFL